MAGGLPLERQVLIIVYFYFATKMTRNVEGGVYVLRFSKKTVKIGMGSNIERRLRQYRGYHRHGKDYPRLLIIKSKYPR